MRPRRNLKPAEITFESLNADGRKFITYLADMFEVEPDYCHNLVFSESSVKRAGTSVEDGVITSFSLSRLYHDLFGYENRDQYPIQVDFSLLPELISLEIDNLPLTGADISQCRKLKHIKAENTIIPTFDFSHTPELEEIDLSRNKIFHDEDIHRYNDIPLGILDLSHQSKLRKLSCANAGVTALNLHPEAPLKELHCSGNAITEIALPVTKSLEKISIEKNPLKTLDLTGQSAITDIMIRETEIEEIHVSHMPELECLLLPERVKTVDVTQNRNIRHIICSSLMEEIDLSSAKNLRAITLGKSMKTVDLSQTVPLYWVTFTNDIEVTCTEVQSYTVDGLKELNSNKPTAEQKEILKIHEAHSKASSHNWDEGLAPLKRILKKPNCDIATAKMIYWLGQPHYYQQFRKAGEIPKVNQTNYRFIKKLEKDILAGVYTTNEISFDPSEEFPVKDAEECKWEIPPQLYEPSTGNEKSVLSAKKRVTLEYCHKG